MYTTVVVDKWPTLADGAGETNPADRDERLVSCLMSTTLLGGSSEANASATTLARLNVGHIHAAKLRKRPGRRAWVYK